LSCKPAQARGKRMQLDRLNGASSSRCSVPARRRGRPMAERPAIRNGLSLAGRKNKLAIDCSASQHGGRSVRQTVYSTILLVPLISSVCSAQTSPSTVEESFQRLGQRLDQAQQLLSGEISQTSGLVPSGAMAQAVKSLELIVLEFRDNN